jgi:GT2 family glycosyltransferase
MSMSGRVLSVYIIHWNAPEWCLSSIRSILASTGVRVAVVVVDNASLTDEQAAVLRGAGARVIRLGRNTGYTGGANVALREWLRSCPDQEYVLLASHDLHLRPDALTRLIEAADAHPQYGIIGPVFTAPHRVAGGYWTGRRAVEFPIDGATGLVARELIRGACMLLRRQCVLAVGKFDERFSSYLEDTDYCLRAQDRGWKVGVCMDAVGWELGSISPRARELVDVNSARLAMKRHGFQSLLPIIAPLLVLMARNAVAAIAPWRSAVRRETSRASLKLRVRVLSQILTGLVQPQPPRGSRANEVSPGWRR